MKRYVALAVMALLGALAVTSTSNAAPLGGTALSRKSATVDTSAVTMVSAPPLPALPRRDCWAALPRLRYHP